MKVLIFELRTIQKHLKNTYESPKLNKISYYYCMIKTTFKLCLKPLNMNLK